MRPCSDLLRLRRTGVRRLTRLRARIVARLHASTNVLDTEMAYVTIEASNYWAGFCRSFALSCPFGARRVGGARAGTTDSTLTSPGAILHAANKAIRGAGAPAPIDRRDEPDWKAGPNFLRICQALSLSNIDAVNGAMSLRSRVLEDLPTFRNFFAHRNPETAARALKVASTHYLIKGVAHPTLALKAVPFKRTQPLILDWLDDIQVISELLCD